MNCITVAVTDTGISKNINQDSVFSKVMFLENKEVSFSIVCDGMGGLSEGEVASKSVVSAFCKWLDSDLSGLLKREIDFEKLKIEWGRIITEQNKALSDYGASKNIRLGTTLTALLIVDDEYYGVHVGDTRIYEISDGVYQLTEDHTLVARDVRMGNITSEQAKKDPRQNILLQCIGASDIVNPDFLYGKAERNVIYMLCSDGFRHVISEEEIYLNFNYIELAGREEMLKKASHLIELNKSREEKDNISVILLRTF